jgi:hypothetical protein
MPMMVLMAMAKATEVAKTNETPTLILLTG